MGLGKGLGIATTAEGVETAEQLHKVRNEGGTAVQGCSFGTTELAAALREYFEQRAA